MKNTIIIANTILLYIMLLTLVVSMPVQFIEFAVTEENTIKKHLEKKFYQLHCKIQDQKKKL